MCDSGFISRQRMVHRHTLTLARVVGPRQGMKQAGEGKIVNITSGAGLQPSLTGIQGYTAAKHAEVGLTKQLVS